MENGHASVAFNYFKTRLSLLEYAGLAQGSPYRRFSLSSLTRIW